MKTELEVKLPAYSLPYLINGDDSGLTDEDIAIIDSWYDGVREMEDKAAIIISPIVADFEEYFSSSPEFGLPCSVVECKIIFI